MADGEARAIIVAAVIGGVCAVIAAVVGGAIMIGGPLVVGSASANQDAREATSPRENQPPEQARSRSASGSCPNEDATIEAYRSLGISQSGIDALIEDERRKDCPP